MTTPTHIAFILLITAYTVGGCNDASFGGKTGKSTDQDNGAASPDDADDDLDVGDQNGAEDAGKDDDDPADNDSDSAESYSPEDIETDADVAKLCSKKTAKKLTSTINFPENTSACPWGKDDNGEKINTKIQARIEQDVTVNLPANSLICTVAFDFPSQEIVYDDHIFLMLDRYVLAASKFSPDHFAADGDLMIYDWAKLKGMGFSGDDAAVCLGGAAATCIIPATDTLGKMELKIPDAMIQALSAKLKDVSEYKFKFVTTGDNDESKDCKHAPVKFDLTVEYLKLKP